MDQAITKDVMDAKAVASFVVGIIIIPTLSSTRGPSEFDDKKTLTHELSHGNQGDPSPFSYSTKILIRR